MLPWRFRQDFPPKVVNFFKITGAVFRKAATSMKYRPDTSNWYGARGNYLCFTNGNKTILQLEVNQDGVFWVPRSQWENAMAEGPPLRLSLSCEPQRNARSLIDLPWSPASWRQSFSIVQTGGALKWFTSAFSSPLRIRNNEIRNARTQCRKKKIQTYIKFFLMASLP